jgi:hypothetical protein
MGEVGFKEGIATPGPQEGFMGGVHQGWEVLLVTLHKPTTSSSSKWEV